MKKTLIYIIVAVVIIAAVVVGVRLAYKPAPKEQVYKIGAILPLTGPAATVGQDMKWGMEAAVEDIKKNLGLHLELRIEDGQSDPKASLSAFRKLIYEKYRIFITTMSSVALAIIPVAREENVLLFADVAHPKASGAGPMIFRHSNTAEQESTNLANYILNHSEIQKVFILWINDDFGLSMKDLIKQKLNIQLQDESFAKDQTDFRSYAVKISEYSPHAVIVIGYGKPLGLAIKALREGGYKGNIFTNIGFVATPDAVATAGEAAQGVYYNDFDFQKSDPKYIELQTQYKERFGRDLPTVALIEYNNLLLIAEGLKRVGDEPEKLANYIKSLKEYRGVGEDMKIELNGDILPKIALKQFGK